MPPDPPRFQSFSFKSIPMPVIYSCSNLFGRVVSWFWTKIIFQLCLSDTAERIVVVQSTLKPTTPAQPIRLTRIWKQTYLSVKNQTTTSTVQGPGGVILEGDFTVHVCFAKWSVCKKKHSNFKCSASWWCSFRRGFCHTWLFCVTFCCLLCLFIFSACRPHRVNCGSAQLVL